MRDGASNRSVLVPTSGNRTQWLADRVSKVPKSGNVYDGLVTMRQELTRDQTAADDDMFKHPRHLFSGRGFKFIEFRSTTISSCPATWEVVEYGYRTFNTTPARMYSITIHPIGQPISYLFSSLSSEPADQAAMRKEMAAIRDSIKLVNLVQQAGRSTPR